MAPQLPAPDMTLPPSEIALVLARAHTEVWDPVLVCYWYVLMVARLGWYHAHARDIG
jgi:hypothetical protein